MRTIQLLSRAAYGVHAADQTALVAVPLVAALAFDASAQTIGILVACQSLAHLIGSLPFGILVDRGESRRVALGAIVLCVMGFLGAATCVWAKMIVPFAFCVVLGSGGIVLFVLTTLSILPKTAEAAHLASANAALELPRAAASFAVPLVLGLVVTAQTAGLVFGVGALLAATALIWVWQLPSVPVAPAIAAPPSPLRQIKEGAYHVLRSQILRAIALCAIFWNLAFAALLVAMVPFLSGALRVEPGMFGIALACFGAGAICGAWVSRRYGNTFQPRVILVLGPLTSMTVPAVLLALPAEGALIVVFAAFFALGFVPSMWLVVQNAVRQTVTPGHVLGRVNAVIQTAIYGVRPLGALSSGAIITAYGVRAGLAFVCVLFTLSAAVAVLTRLRRIQRFSDLSYAD